jgi:hypothetical protein
VQFHESYKNDGLSTSDTKTENPDPDHAIKNVPPVLIIGVPF